MNALKASHKIASEETEDSFFSKKVSSLSANQYNLIQKVTETCSATMMTASLLTELAVYCSHPMHDQKIICDQYWLIT